MTQQRFDVVIIGGGVAGCATAISLKQVMPGLSVVIIERNRDEPKTTSRIGETLPPHTVVQLQQLGLWQSFNQCGFLPAYGTCAAWGSETLHHNEFITSPYGHGWHLNRNAFDDWLVTQARQRDIEFIHDCKINRGVEQTDDGWILPLSNEAQIHCQFVVDATGHRASFAASQGAKKVLDDQLVGLFRLFELDDATKIDSSAMVESHQSGWWYSAMLPDNRMVMALMTDADIAHQDHSQKSDIWLQTMQGTTHTKQRFELTQINPTSNETPTVIAAHSQCLDKLAGAGWLAVGDAALTYDPLSSLGIFKALRMGTYASYAIADSFKGIDQSLNKYQHVARSEYQGYLAKRREYYQQEQRFSEALFWARRR